MDNNSTETFLRVGIDGTASLDGARVVKRSINDIDAAVNKSGQNWKQYYNQNTSASAQATQAMGGHMKQIENSAKGALVSIKDLEAMFVRLIFRTAAIATIYGTISLIKKGFQEGVKAVEEFQTAIVQIAAGLTQIGIIGGKTNLAETYKQSKEYAQALVLKMQEIDPLTMANSKGLMSMLQVMTNQGVVLDINKKKQVEAFTDISNAIATMTAGQDQQMQMYQETRALLSGQVNMHAQVSKNLDLQIKQQGIYKGGLKEVVQLGRENNDLLERLAPYFAGLREASMDIAQLWTSVKTSFETAMNVVLRAGFTSVVKDMVEIVGALNKYLKENSEIIGKNIAEAWKNVMVVIQVVRDNADGLITTIKVLAEGAKLFVGYWLLTQSASLIGAIGAWIAAKNEMLILVLKTQAAIDAGIAVDFRKGAGLKVVAAEQLAVAETNVALAQSEVVSINMKIANANATRASILVDIEQQSILVKLMAMQAEQLGIEALVAESKVRSIALRIEDQKQAIIATTAWRQETIANLESFGLTELAQEQQILLKKEQLALSRSITALTQQEAAATIAAAEAQNLASVATGKHAAADLLLTQQKGRLSGVNALLAKTTLEATAATVTATGATEALTAAQKRNTIVTKEQTAAWFTLGNAVNVLMAAWIGWEIGSFLNKFEIVRKAGVAMVYGIMGAWHELETAWDRFKVTINPFGDEDEQQAKLAKITADYNAWMINFKKNYKEQMKDVEQNPVVKVAQATITAPKGNKAIAEVETSLTAADKAFNRMVDAWDKWNQKAILSGRIQDELYAAIDANNAELASDLAELAESNDKDVVMMRERYTMQAKLINQNLTLTANQKAERTLERAEHQASMAAYKSDLEERRSELKLDLEDRIIMNKTYYSEMEENIQKLSEIEIQKAQEIFDEKKELVDKGYANVDVSYSHMLSLIAEQTKAESELNSVSNNMYKMLNENSREALRVRMKEKDMLVELKNITNSMYGDLASTQASKVGTSSLTGEIVDPLQNQLAIIEDAHNRKLNMLKDEQDAIIRKAETEVLSVTQISELKEQVRAKQIEMDNADSQRSQDIVFAHMESATAMYSTILAQASKTFPKITALESAGYLVNKQYAEGVALAEGSMFAKFVSHFKGKLQMQADYFAVGSELLLNFSEMEDESSRKGFESSKALNLAAATMSTAAAVMNQMAGGDPYTAWARASAAAIMGAAQIASIANTSFGGGSGSVSAPSGSFAGGGASGDSGTGNIGINTLGPLLSVKDGQTGKQLDLISERIGNAALAMGRSADSLFNIAEALKPDSGLVKSAPGKYTGLQQITSGIGGILSGFGREIRTTGSGITVGMDRGNVTGNTYVSKDNGNWWTGSNAWLEFGKLPALFKSELQGALTSMNAGLRRGSVSLGASGADFDYALSNTTVKDMGIATAGRSDDAISKDIIAAFTKIGNTLIEKVFPNIMEFATSASETATDVWTRLSTAIMDVNFELSKVGKTLLSSSLANGDLAFRLQELMGGAEEFSKSIDTYFNSIFTDTEQKAATAAQATQQVKIAFIEMGLAVPTTREQFKGLVNSMNLTSTYGASTFAALMGISEAFGIMIDASDEVKKAIVEFANDLTVRTLKLDGLTKAAELFSLRIAQEIEYKDALEAGMDVAALAIVQNREWAAAIADTTGIITDSITLLINAAKDSALAMIDAQTAILNTMKNIKTGPLAQLSPEAAYQQAQASFAAIMNKTDIDSLKALPQTATSLLEASKAYNASSVGYQNDLNMVLGVLGNAAGINGDSPVTQLDQQLILLESIKQAIVKGDSENLSAILSGNEVVPATVNEQLASLLGPNSTLASLIGAWNEATAAKLLAEKKEVATEVYNRDLSKFNTAMSGINDQFTSGTTSASTYLEQQNAALGTLGTSHAAATALGATVGALPTVGTIDPSLLAARQATEQATQSLSNIDAAKIVLDMAIGLTTAKIMWDLNKDGIVTIADALLVMQGKRPLGSVLSPTVPTSGYNPDGSKTMVFPAFANGGFHSGGLRIVGERGPEIENTGAARYWTSEQTQKFLSGSADNKRIEELLEQQNNSITAQNKLLQTQLLITQEQLKEQRQSTKSQQSIEQKTKLVA